MGILYGTPDSRQHYAVVGNHLRKEWGRERGDAAAVERYGRTCSSVFEDKHKVLKGFQVYLLCLVLSLATYVRCVRALYI